MPKVFMASEVVFSRRGAENAEEAYTYDGIWHLLVSSVYAITNTHAADSLNQYASISTLCASVPPCEPTNPDNPENPVEDNFTSPREPSFDPDGNLLTNGVFTYAYDADNRLASVSSNGFAIATFSYDAQGRRVRKIVSHGGTEAQRFDYLYDGWLLVRETATGLSTPLPTNSSTGYVWGKDLSGTIGGAGGVGGLLYVSICNSSTPNSSTPQLFFPFYDAMGNILRYTDTAGNVVASYTYDAFGRTISATGPLAHLFRHLFSTKYYDTETGLYYYGCRFYSPDLMRWLNRDPIEEAGGVNLYAFCGNNVLSRFDAHGLSVDKSGFKNYGAVSKERYQALYKSAIGVPGESYIATDSYGFTLAVVKYSVKVVPCGSGKCYKLTVASDVSLSGSMAWKLFLDYYDPDSGLPVYNKNWQYRGRSGRSVEDHEREHLKHAEYHADNADLMLHRLADGKISSRECAGAKRSYLHSVTRYILSVRIHDDAELDYEDYPQDSLGEVTERLSSAVEKMEEMASKLQIAQEIMEKACAR